MRPTLAVLVVLLAGCGDDTSMNAPLDLSASAPHDLHAATGCPTSALAATGPCLPVDLVCSFATDASPSERCRCDDYAARPSGTWQCGNCRVFPQYFAGTDLTFEFPNCQPVDDNCVQPWGEFVFTCRCLPDGRGRCCADDSGPHCFDTDGG